MARADARRKPPSTLGQPESAFAWVKVKTAKAILSQRNMQHSIKLSEQAFLAYERRARAVGLTVEQHLDRSAPNSEFTLTPEMRACIERGLAQSDAGKVVAFDQVRESLAQYRAEWQAENDR